MLPLPLATGVFRAATSVAAAPQRGANPSFATEGRGVSVGRGGSDEEKAEGLTDYRQVVERSETPVTDARSI